MENNSSLFKYQKCMLLLLLVLAVGFAVLTIIGQKTPGLAINDGFLTLSLEDGGAVYAGKVMGDPMTITVTPSGQEIGVHVHVEGKVELPYRVVFPEGNITYLGVSFPKMEIYQGETLIFQGAYDPAPLRWSTDLREADGRPYEGGIIVGTGAVEDWENFSLDPYMVYRLARQQTFHYRGSWSNWFWMVLLSCLLAVDVFNPYALFGWLSREPEEGEHPVRWTRPGILRILFGLFSKELPDEETFRHPFRVRHVVILTLILLWYMNGVQQIKHIL